MNTAPEKMLAPLIEAHFSGMASQSSIYGLTSLSTHTGSHKVLTASSKRKVYCSEYSWNNKALIPSTREVQFTYIPGAAEIVSIDAFNQAFHEHDFVVGITFVKGDTTGKKSQYFNIYSDWKPSSECDLDNIAQGCLSLPLEFIPFQLTHTELTENGSKEIVWLLSGDDNQVHLYREDKSHQSFCEQPSEKFFPELKDLTSVVLWMDFINMNGSRLTAFGCKNGIVSVALIELITDAKILSSWSIEHDSSISCVRLFFDFKSDDQSSRKCPILESPIHLLVCNTLEVSVVYRDIMKKGLNLSNQYLLPGSNNFDCATCACIADFDMDGKNEILVGTYGQQLLGFKWQDGTADAKGCYFLIYAQEFPNPLLSVSYIDIIGDGLNEMLVLSTKGLHILQHDHNMVAELCIQRMKALLQREKNLT